MRRIPRTLVENSRSHRPKILVAEAEHTVAVALEANLVKLGYSVVAAVDSGRKAVQLAEKLTPDLVLMDIHLHGTPDGIAAATQIRRRTQIPVIFVTENGGDETMERAAAASPYGYVSKPVRMKDLKAAILAALHQRKLVSALFEEHLWPATILENIGDAVVATDAAGGIRFQNMKAEALGRWTLAEALGKPIEEVYAISKPNGAAVLVHLVRRALDTKAATNKERFLLISRRDSPVAIEISAVPVFKGGVVIGAVAVFMDVSERLRLDRSQEAERGRLEEQVQIASEALGQTRAELRALSGHVLSAQEEERRRVARELHDDFAQRTALLELQAERLAAYVPDPASEGGKLLAAMREQMAALNSGLTEVSRRLYPSILTDLGLVAALRSLVEAFQQIGADAHLRVQRLSSDIPAQTATALYRIAQEALRNATKHAPGAPVRTTLSEKAGELHLTIEDAGPGFEVKRARKKHGLGLLSMQERARMAGGTFQLRTRPGDGATVHIRVPIPEPGAAEK